MTATGARAAEYAQRWRAACAEIALLRDPLERTLGEATARVEAQALLKHLEALPAGTADDAIGVLRGVVAGPGAVGPFGTGADRTGAVRTHVVRTADGVARSALAAVTLAALTGTVPVAAGLLAAAAVALRVLDALGDLHGWLLSSAVVAGAWGALLVWRSVGSSPLDSRRPTGTWTWAEELAVAVDLALLPSRQVAGLVLGQAGGGAPALTDRARSRAQTVVATALFVGAVAVASVGWTVLRAFD